MMKDFDHRRFLLIPAVLLGMVVGLFTHEALEKGGPDGAMSRPDFLQVVGVTGGVYLILTIVVFRVRSTTFGLTPAQLRVGWLGAFVLGAVGTPILYELAIR